MKKIRTGILALMLTALFSSCIFSLFPIYTENSIVFQPALLGTWKGENSSIIFEKYLPVKFEFNLFDSSNSEEFIVINEDTIRDVESAEIWEDSLDSLMSESFTDLPKKELKYKMTSIQDRDTSIFEVTLAQIGDKIYMDLYPYDGDMRLSNLFEYNNMPVHTFMRIVLNENQFTIISFDLEKLSELFESNRIRLRHESTDDFILITAKAKDIQKFLSTYSEQKEVFEEPEVYTRVSL